MGSGPRWFADIDTVLWGNSCNNHSNSRCTLSLRCGSLETPLQSTCDSPKDGLYYLGAREGGTRVSVIWVRSGSRYSRGHQVINNIHSQISGWKHFILPLRRHPGMINIPSFSCEHGDLMPSLFLKRNIIKSILEPIKLTEDQPQCVVLFV